MLKIIAEKLYNEINEALELEKVSETLEVLDDVVEDSAFDKYKSELKEIHLHLKDSVERVDYDDIEYHAALAMDGLLNIFYR